MSTRLLVLSVILLCLVRIGSVSMGSDQGAPRALVFTRTAGFRHASIPDGIAAIRARLAPAWTVDQSEDPSLFTPESLRKYRAVIFLSTTGDILDESQQSALAEWVKSGGGWIGIHAAADTEHGWPWYGSDLCCARFVAHPPTQRSTVVVEDRVHPSTRMLPPRWERTDEWYAYDRSPRKVNGVRILASMDGSTIEGAKMDGDHPIAWCRELGAGRAWYTGGGHTCESFSEPLFMDHVIGGIAWASRTDAGLPQDQPRGGSAAPAPPAGAAAP